MRFFFRGLDSSPEISPRKPFSHSRSSMSAFAGGDDQADRDEAPHQHQARLPPQRKPASSPFLEVPHRASSSLLPRPLSPAPASPSSNNAFSLFLSLPEAKSVADSLSGGQLSPVKETDDDVSAEDTVRSE